MSFYTRFADTESLISSSSTAQGPLLSPADSLLVFSSVDSKYHKTTVAAAGLAGAGFSPISTSTSTAAPIPATAGTFIVTAAASNAAVAEFMLSTPALPGIVMNFFNSSSTSTFIAIMSESTGALFFPPGATAGGSPTIQFACSYQSFGIVSGYSTTGAQGGPGWFVTYKSTGVYSS